MTAVVDDPLIAGMVIAGCCHCTSRAAGCGALPGVPPRLRSRGDVGRVKTALVAVGGAYHRAAAGDVRRRRRGDGQPGGRRPAARGHAGPRRHRPGGALVVLEGRAWDTGLENLWVHVDSEGAIDWVGVVDPTLRALPETVLHGRADAAPPRPGRNGRAAQRGGACDLGRAPEPPRARTVVRQTARGQRRRLAWRRCGTRRFRRRRAATQVPLLAGSSEVVGMRRGQAVLDALVGFGLPVRGQSTRADGAGIQFGRITGKVLRN